MKKIFLKSMILAVIGSILIGSLNIDRASAAWNKDTNSNIIWTENGVKATGWKNINQKWYYFYSNGAMATGWLQDGTWYYLYGSGEMATGWLKDNDKWYHLSNSGSMTKGWLYGNDGKWYYLSSSGAMITGWFDDNGKRYYLNSSGDMVTGEFIIDGIKYNFASDGSLIDTNVNAGDNSGQAGRDEEADKDNSDEIKEEIRIGYVNTGSSYLNVRAEASLTSEIIGSIQKGSEVSIIGNEKGGFFKVSYKDKQGYVSSSFISFEKPSAPDLNITLGDIRTTAPTRDNKYYYSDLNIFHKAKYAPGFYKSNGQPIIGNCTWYAWGRMWELTGRIPIDAGLNGNAYEWWNANKSVGKYKYGSTPKVGAVAVWKTSMSSSSGSGHVAVVEKIENGKVYISESAWQGVLFKYREIYNTEHLYGYIYIDEPNF